MRQLTIVQDDGNDFNLDADTNIIVRDNSVCKIRVKYSDNCNLSAEVGRDSKVYLIEHVDIKRMDCEKNIIVGENAELHWITVYSDSGAKCRQKVTLLGDNSKVVQYTIIVDKEKNTYDIDVTSEHIGKSTYSLIHERGALKDSNAKLRGLVKIDKNASGSNGYQRSDVMILGNAKINTIPDLEIHNDNVKCTHGSSITRPDKERLFYLESRGIARDEAEDLIIKGFYEDLIAKIPEVQEQVRSLL
jgi:Fe-S cluster assembly scaffold protein SufB